MTDNIVDIAFTDVKIFNVSSTPFVASITGTIEVDYTSGMVTNCALTASGTGFITTSFTNATLTALPRPHVRLSTGRPVSQYAGNEGCAG